MIDGSDPSSARSSAMLQSQLETSPFSHLLVVAADKRLNGTVALQTTSGESVQIGFDAGRPKKVRTSAEIARLGDVLVDLGHLTKPRLARTVTEIAILRRLLGELLLEEGALTEEQLRHGLEEQLRRKLLYAAALPFDTSIAYYDHVDLMAGWGGSDFAAIDARSILLRVLWAAPPWRHVDAALARIGNKPMHLSSRADLESFALTADQRRAAERLEAPMTTAEWISGVTRNREAELFLYLLIITRQVTVMDASLPPPPPSSGASGAVIKEAPLSLSIPPARASLLPPSPVSDGTPGPSRVSARPRIEDVEKHVQAQRLAEAEATCREILVFDPKNADVLATLVWLEGLKAENPAPQAMQRMLNTLTRIAAGAPTSWRPLFWRALVSKRAGDHHGAARDFKAVVAMNPSHEASNAELRLYKLRIARGSLTPPRR